MPHLRMHLLFVAALVISPCILQAAEKTHFFEDAWGKGDLVHIDVTYEAGGNLSIQGGEKAQQIPMELQAKVACMERRTSARLAVRRYENIDVRLRIGDTRLSPQLRDEQRLLVAEIADGRRTIFSPSAPLSREELDLVTLPADSLVVARLLPPAPLAIGGTWKIDDETLAQLLGVDEVGRSEVEGVLDDVTERFGKFKFAGTVHGAVDGIATEIELNGRCYFDRQQSAVTDVQAHCVEKRAIGHVNPGIDVTSKVHLQLRSVDVADLPEDIRSQLFAQVGESSPERLRLLYEPEHGRYRLQHDRAWHVTDEDSRTTILRRVNRGELIAQCNLHAPPPLAPGQRVPFEKFRDDIRQSLGDNFGAFRYAKESANEERAIYRVVAEGTVAELPIQWIYYLITDRQGRQFSLVYTMEATLVEEFGDNDVDMIASIELLGPGGDDLPTESEDASRPEADESSADAKSEEISVTIKEEETGEMAANDGEMTDSSRPNSSPTTPAKAKEVQSEGETISSASGFDPLKSFRWRRRDDDQDS